MPELYIHPQKRYQKLYSFLHTQQHLDFLDRILVVVQLVVEVHHKYQTCHFYLKQDLLHLQHVHGKSLHHHCTWDHLGKDHNLQAPNHYLKHFHHIHEKRCTQPAHFHPYILESLGYLHKMNLFQVHLQKTSFQLQDHLLYSHQD